MTLHLLDRHLLGRATSRVVKRADCEQVLAAEDLLEAARESTARQYAQLEACRQSARQAGYAAGVEAGREAWAQQLLERHRAGQAQLHDLQDVLAGVVMDALRHLVAELPAEHRFALLAPQVLKSVIRARQVRLVVAAADAAAAQLVLERWHREQPDVMAIDVVVDDALSVGDCVLETDEGAIDGRLGQRLTTIEAALGRQLSAAVSPPAGTASPRTAPATPATSSFP
jgi:type III secretion protein L